MNRYDQLIERAEKAGIHNAAAWVHTENSHLPLKQNPEHSRRPYMTPLDCLSRGGDAEMALEDLLADLERRNK